MLVLLACAACGGSAAHPAPGRTPDVEPSVVLRHRLGDGAPLRYQASASLAVGSREWSARATFDVLSTRAARAPTLALEVSLLALATADERGSVELGAGRARVTLTGTLAREASVSDLAAMRELDDLASVLGADLSTRRSLSAPVAGGEIELGETLSPAGAAAFVALLVPELPERALHLDDRWVAASRAAPLGPDAGCRAEHRLVRFADERAHVRFRCRDFVIHGLETRMEGSFVMDVGRGAVVELEARASSPHATADEAAIEASWGAHLDE